MLRRIAIGIGVLFAVSILVFLATQALPGDVARVILGRDATAEQVAVLRERLGLDQPLVVQYLHWLGGALRGDFG
ncbi:ABC transporter permease, partial [Streptomyces scabiei]